MIEADKIEAISAADVRSSDDDKVGSVGQVFLDPQTGRPEWAVVKTGIFGTKGAFVPLRNASWDGRVVRLAYDKERVRNAPQVSPDERGLDPDQQVQLYTYYGFTEATTPAHPPTTTPSTATSSNAPSNASPSSATSSNTTPSNATSSNTTPSNATPSATPGSEPRAATDDAPVSLTDTARAAMESDEPPAATTEPTPLASLSETAAAAMADSRGYTEHYDDTTTDQPTHAAAGIGPDADDATMTRMEEHLQVSVEQTATERVRLRKHIVTTQETVTVTVRREELRIERVPITADEARQLGSGTGIAESDTEIVLYEERPVVTTVARPVERIRLTREVVAEEQTVTGDVRKERIEVEGGAIG